MTCSHAAQTSHAPHRKCSLRLVCNMSRLTNCYAQAFIFEDAGDVPVIAQNGYGGSLSASSAAAFHALVKDITSNADITNSGAMS